MTPDSPHLQETPHRLQPSEGEDECGPHRTVHKTTLIEDERLGRRKMLQYLDIDEYELPTYPRFASSEERLRSFKHWPAGMPVSPEALSEAGFFYSSHGDRTYCFQCGGMLEGWRRDDIPWREHARWHPTCRLVKARKQIATADDPSVRKFHTVARAHKDMKDAINNVRELVSSIDINKVDTKDMKSAIEALKGIVSGVDTENDDLSVSKNYDNDSNDKDAAPMEGSSSPPPGSPKWLSCIICLVNPRDSVILPCYHVATCMQCASKLEKCSVCRKNLTGFTRVYIS